MTKAAQIIKAEEIKKVLVNSEIGTKLAPKVWAPKDADFARVYTGCKGDYLQIDESLRVTTSTHSIAWGHIIRDLVDIAS